MIYLPRPLSQRAARAAARFRDDGLLAGLAVQVVAAATRITPEDILVGRGPGGRAQRARNVAMYLAHVGYNWSLTRVGAAFERDRTTAGAACRWVEDERDDPQLDDLLERLERALRDFAEALPQGGAT